MVKRRVSYHTGLNPAERTDQHVLVIIRNFAAQRRVLILCGTKPNLHILFLKPTILFLLGGKKNRGHFLYHCSRCIWSPALLGP